MNCLNCGFISFKLAKKCGNCGTGFKKLSQNGQNTLVRNKAFAIYIGSVGDSTASTAVELEEKEFEIESPGLDTPPILDSPPAQEVDLIDTDFDLDLSDVPESDAVSLSEPEEHAGKDGLAKTVGLAGGVGIAVAQSLDLEISEAVSEEELDGDFVLDLDSTSDGDSVEAKDDLEPKASIEAEKVDSDLGASASEEILEPAGKVDLSDTIESEVEFELETDLKVSDSEEKLEPVGEVDIDISDNYIELGLEELEIKEDVSVAQDLPTVEDNDTEFELEELEVEGTESNNSAVQEQNNQVDGDVEFKELEIESENANETSTADGDVEFELESDIEDEKKQNLLET
jgi:hypothetical protein